GYTVLRHPPGALIEVALAPAQVDRVDAVGDRMVVVYDQAPVLAQGRAGGRGEQAGLGHQGQCPLSGVDHRKAAPAELERQLVQLGLEERRVGRPFAGGGESLRRRVDPAYEGAESAKVGSRLADAAGEMEHVLA